MANWMMTKRAWQVPVRRAFITKADGGRPPHEVRANFMRTLALPSAVQQWSLTTLLEKLVKIGAKVISHGRYVTFQLAEVAVTHDLFRKILRLIDELRREPEERHVRM